jgi:hypothetical protein
MFVARTDKERELLDRFARRIGGATTPPAPSKPLNELERVTDNQYELVRSALTEQVEPLRQAYLRGMAAANDDEQCEVLAWLSNLIDQ